MSEYFWNSICCRQGPSPFSICCRPGSRHECSPGTGYLVRTRGLPHSPWERSGSEGWSVRTGWVSKDSEHNRARRNRVSQGRRTYGKRRRIGNTLEDELRILRRINNGRDSSKQKEDVDSSVLTSEYGILPQNQTKHNDVVLWALTHYIFVVFT